MHVVIYGPPGFLWKLPNFKECMDTLNLYPVRMRLCRFDIKFDKQNAAPSGTYIQVATNNSLKYSKDKFGCRCKVGINQHVLDWYGHTAERAEWRRKTLQFFSQMVCDVLFGRIQDSSSPPCPITPPTDWTHEDYQCCDCFTCTDFKSRSPCACGHYPCFRCRVAVQNDGMQTLHCIHCIPDGYAVRVEPIGDWLEMVKAGRDDVQRRMASVMNLR